jgi:hypothetical protein
VPAPQQQHAAATAAAAAPAPAAGKKKTADPEKQAAMLAQLQYLQSQMSLVVAGSGGGGGGGGGGGDGGGGGAQPVANKATTQHASLLAALPKTPKAAQNKVSLADTRSKVESRMGQHSGPPPTGLPQRSQTVRGIGNVVSFEQTMDEEDDEDGETEIDAATGVAKPRKKKTISERKDRIKEVSRSAPFCLPPSSFFLLAFVCVFDLNCGWVCFAAFIYFLSAAFVVLTATHPLSCRSQLRSLREDGNNGSDYSDLYRKSRRGSLGDVDTRAAMEAELRQIYVQHPANPTQANPASPTQADDSVTEQPRQLAKLPSSKPVKLKDLRR